MSEQPIRVLLLDDEESLRKPLTDYLHNTHGFIVDATGAVDFIMKAEGVPTLLSTVEDVLKTVAVQKQGTRPQPKVFIAHGHDSEARETVSAFLRDIGIKPIILFEEADRGETIIEKLERCCREADFAIVLFTPDDFGYPKEDPCVPHGR